MSTMATGSYSSAWNALWYLVWRHRRRPSAPSYVKRTFVGLVAVLCLSFVIKYVCTRVQRLPVRHTHETSSVADLWLHLSTSPIPLTSPTGFQGTAPQASLVANMTACPNGYPNSCSFGTDDFDSDQINGWGTDVLIHIGDEVAGNDSDVLQVMQLPATTGNTTTAVILPILTDLPEGIMFQSTTYGMSVQCSSLTMSSVCENSFPFNTFNVSCSMPNAVATTAGLDPNSKLPGGFFNSSIYIEANEDTGKTVTYNLESSEGGTLPLQWWGGNVTNPFGLGQALVFESQSADMTAFTSQEFHSNINWQFYSGACTVGVYDVVLAYSNGSYTVHSQSLADSNLHHDAPLRIL